MRQRALCLFLVPLSMCLLSGQPGAAEEPSAPLPWFTNVSAAVGLGEVRAKDCIFTDVDGDGFLDLCLDRERLYLSRQGGTRFEPHLTHGIPYPDYQAVPLAKDGTPQPDRAKSKRLVPQYLYFADVDNDGDMDALYGIHSNWERLEESDTVPPIRTWKRIAALDHGHRSRVFLNDGKGHFSPAPDSPFSSDAAAGPAMALAMLDFDGDGNLDLYEGREYRQYGQLYGCGVDRLWKGDGHGRFVDVTEQAGLLTVAQEGGPRSSRPSYGVTHADIDGDGWPDLLQMAYGRQWNYLWRNKGDGTFEEIGVASGFAGDAITHGKYPPWTDAARARWKQKYGDRPLPTRADELPFRSNGNTFDCAVGDIDGDGDLDLFLGEIAHYWAGTSSDLPSLLINEGGTPPRFTRKTVREALPARAPRSAAWNLGDLHAAMLDVDNDGRLDLLIGSGDYPDGQFLRLYHQQADGSFAEVTTLAGFDWEGCGDLSIGDFDRDGDVDILAGRSFARLNQKHRDQFMGGLKVNVVGLFRNDVANTNGNHFANVHLVGKGSGKGACNRTGLGARVLLTVGGRTQIREVRGGSGLANHQDAPEACFGLGKAKMIDRLEVRWSGKGAVPQVFKNVPADYFITVEQDSPQLRLRGPEQGR